MIASIAYEAQPNRLKLNLAARRSLSQELQSTFLPCPRCGHVRGHRLKWAIFNWYPFQSHVLVHGARFRHGFVIQSLEHRKRIAIVSAPNSSRFKIQVIQEIRKHISRVREILWTFRAKTSFTVPKGHCLQLLNLKNLMVRDRQLPETFIHLRLDGKEWIPHSQ
jgi:hypothetical protein